MVEAEGFRGSDAILLDGLFDPENRRVQPKLVRYPYRSIAVSRCLQEGFAIGKPDSDGFFQVQMLPCLQDLGTQTGMGVVRGTETH
jgi:hypothetical protein